MISLPRRALASSSSSSSSLSPAAAASRTPILAALLSLQTAPPLPEPCRAPAPTPLEPHRRAIHGSTPLLCGDMAVRVLNQEMDLSTTAALIKDYLLVDPNVKFTAVLCGILMCTTVYVISRLISSFVCKCYGSLSDSQKFEWNTRGMSSVLAIFITMVSVYLVFFTNLFSDQLDGPVTFRRSNLSNFALGVSIGYFITELAMIVWTYLWLAGMQYVLHRLLSIISMVYAIYSGEGQLYMFMNLICEATTPGLNLRWFLATAGMKRSTRYRLNRFAVFVTWLVFRGNMPIYLFSHVYFYYDEFKQMDIISRILVFPVPTMIAVRNAMGVGNMLKHFVISGSKEK